MRLSCQLYTLRDQLTSSPEPIFEALSNAGLQFVETAGVGSLTPADYRSLLDQAGLKVSASHVGLSDMESNMDKVIEDGLAIGTPTLVVPWLDEKDRPDMKLMANRLELLAQKAASAGLNLAYHNHSFEFNNAVQVQPLEELFANAPRLRAQLDLGWIQYAGFDPVEYLQRYAGRIDSVHLKDSQRGHPTMDLAPGEGELDFAELIPAAEQNGANFGTIEVDQPRGNALEVVLTAIRYFHSLGLK